MSDTKEILNMILHDEKLLNSRALRDRIYTDEPILRPASQLRRPAAPGRIKEMKGLAFTPEAYWKTSAWLFYTQGKFMEDYEDSFSYNTDFVKYYPSYRELSTEQLRGYFSWRTDVRRGNIKKAPSPFVFIYLYELVNCIGSDDPNECFSRMKSFCDSYRAIDYSIVKYTDVWLADMIVYYRLDAALADELNDIKYDKMLLTLINWESYSNDELFEAIDFLSAYQLKKSLYYSAAPEELKTVLVRSFVSLSRFFRDKRKNSLIDKLFGNMVECSCNMFASAVFYDRQPMRSCEYSLNDIHSFTCTNGKWKCRKYFGNRGRNGRLGDLVRAVDSLMRDKADFKHKISFTGVSKSAVKLIQAEIDSFYEEKYRKEAAKIEIDLSKLAGIRRSADIIREKLIVDEEEISELRQSEENVCEDEKSCESCCELPLDNDEICFMKALLYNGNIADIAKSCGKMVSILADSVNEKLFDRFGDTVIEFTGDLPALIEDYTEELMEMIPDNKE